MLPDFQNAPDRIKTILRRLPVLTRVVLALSVALYVVGSISSIDEALWLDVSEFGFSQLHRLNTYPFIHVGLIHLIFNLVAVTYPLSRFEKEKGTLHTLLMVVGPFSTFPAVAYILISKALLGGSGTYSGLSVWIIMFAAMEATRVFKFKPYYWIVGYRVPSWAPPLGLWLLLEIFVFAGAGWLIHICAMAVGWGFASESLKLLEPPEKILRFVEARLRFLISRVPWYVNLDARESSGHSLFLPQFESDGGRGVDMSTLRMNPRNGGGGGGGSASERSNFSGAGRTLGA